MHAPRGQAPPETDVGSYRIYLSRQPDAGTEEFHFADATVEPRYQLTTLPGTLSEVQVLVRAVNTSDVEGPVSNVVRAAPLATAAELESFHEHLERVLTEAGFLHADHPRAMKLKLRRVFNRATLDRNEVDILRGVLAALDPTRPRRRSE